MVADAQMILTQIQPDPDEMGIAVYHESFHQGVVGIVAGRLREKFHRPAIVFADASEGSNELKGSARSIDGLNIRDVLDSIAHSAARHAPEVWRSRHGGGPEHQAGPPSALSESLR